MDSQILKRMLAWAAVLLLILAGSCETRAETERTVDGSVLSNVYSGQKQIRDMTVNYGAYGEEAEAANAALLEELAAINPDAAARWERILALWKDVDSLPVYADVLPDGLPDTDALCLVALGLSSRRSCLSQVSWMARPRIQSMQNSCSSPICTTAASSWRTPP